MEMNNLLRGRRSCRKFLPDPLPKDLLRDTLDAARWSPSWGNTQPWQIWVATGEALERFRDANGRTTLSGDPLSSDVPMPAAWPEALKQRYGESGRVVFDAMGIKRDDKEARKRFYMDMARLFGAPCFIVICVPKTVSIEYAMLDAGIFLQTLCLAAHARGLGSCIMASSVVYAQLLREHLSIPDDSTIVIGLALGYPDPTDPVNQFERGRVAVDEYVRWKE